MAAAHVWFWQTPSWGWAEAWSLALLFAVSFVPFVPVPSKPYEAAERGLTKRAPLFVALLNGHDGRWSTSKASAVLWTYAVWFAFIATLIHTGAKGLEHAVLKQQYLLLLGIPVAAAVVAKGITQSKVQDGQLPTKQPDGTETNVLSGVGQLVADDRGRPDLLDFQYFGFTLILLAYFFTKFLGNESVGLPELPDTLVGLSGVSAAGYLGKKGLQQDTGPFISTIDPPSGPPGTVVAIVGANLAAAGDSDASVQFGDQSAPVSSATATKIEATVPQVDPGEAAVVLVKGGRVLSNSRTFTITSA
jgi:IPT/TIG domain